MNRTQAQIALLKFSAVLSLILFALVGVSVLDARPNSRSYVSEAMSRMPASLPKLLGEKKTAAVFPGFEVWEPECLSENSKFASFQSKSGWLRVSAATCDK